MTDGMERAVAAAATEIELVFKPLVMGQCISDWSMKQLVDASREAANRIAALPLVGVEREEWSEAERHAVGHARYQVECATPYNPDVSFDYQLVATLLRLIEWLALLPKHTEAREDDDLETVADAIDAARYAHPEHSRERPRPFAEADRGDREYALRLARAAIAAKHTGQPQEGGWELDIVADICQSVAELPDRTSPEDQPDMMLVTHDELQRIVTDALSAAPASPQRAEGEE